MCNEHLGQTKIKSGWNRSIRSRLASSIMSGVGHVRVNHLQGSLLTCRILVEFGSTIIDLNFGMVEFRTSAS